ncbi:hypothetical protein F5B21DRAFT_526810 [Xylaria acuta]|nr:hypothetical protein F5B21DRAFT_526810 [Xylaria acuta]
MSLPITGSQEPPPYASPTSPSDRHKSSSSSPGLKYRFLRLQRPRNIMKGSTREQIDAEEDQVSSIIAEAIEAGFVSKENAHNRTRLHCAIRRCTWPLQLVAHEVKAFKKCWSDFKNKDKLWQAEMTFTIQPRQYEQTAETGQWIEFPSPEDIKWFYVTGPEGVKRLHATDQRHWGPNPNFIAASQPFGEWNGCIVRHPKSLTLTRDFHLFVEQTGPRRCNHCGCVG